MNRFWSDSAVIVVLVCVLLTITLYSRRYVRSVADFLVARRLGGAIYWRSPPVSGTESLWWRCGR